MRRILPLLAVALLASVSAAPEAAAITHGTHDGNAHPNVGALLGSFEVAGGGSELFQVCTGSLMAPDLFLTATHCLNWGATPDMLFVSFETNLQAEEDFSVHPASTIGVLDFWTHPDFRWGGMSTAYNDVAVVKLATDVPLTPVALPPMGYLTAQAAKGGLRGETFMNVGYGDQDPLWSASNPHFVSQWDGFRWKARSLFSGLTKNHLHLLANHAATGGGGICWGDSGGPKFYEGYQVAVTTSADPNCVALNANQRLDTPAVYGFLQSFLAP